MIDPGAVRDLAQAVEDLGFTRISAWDHVVGADLTSRRDWIGPDTLQPIHETAAAAGLPGRGHPAGGAGHRGTGPAATPDRAGGQAGRRDRHAVPRTAAAGHRAGLGGTRIPGAEPGLHRPRPANRGADNAAARLVHPGRGHLRWALASRGRDGDPTAAGTPADPDLGRWSQRPRPTTRGRARRAAGCP